MMADESYIEEDPELDQGSEATEEDGEGALCCKLSLSLRSNLTNKDITSTNLCTDTNDSALIKILECCLLYTSRCV